MRKLCALSLIVLLMAVSLSACGPAPTAEVIRETVIAEEQVEVTRVVVEEAVVTATPVPAEAPSSEPVSGGTLQVGTVQSMTDFNAYSRSFSYWPIARNIYDTLVRYDHELQPQPQLAESWEIAEDYMSMTIELREGVLFHNGRPFTSADVAANLERATDPELGLHQYNANRTVESWETPDDLTVIIRYETPTPAGMMLDALDMLPIIAPESFDKIKQEGIGTGPFKVSEWVPGDYIRLERFDDYWKEGLPYLDEVVINHYTDANAMTLALEGGVLDFMQDTPYRDVTRLEREFDVNLGQAGALYYNMYINPNEGVFTSKEFRQAIQYAMDREAMVDQALHGVGQAKWTAWPEYSVAWSDQWENYYPFDLEKAKELITEAGYGDGAEFTAMVWGGLPEFVSFAQILQADLKEIGVDMTIEVVDQAGFYDALYSAPYEMLFSFGANSNKYPAAQFTGSHYRTENNVLLKPDGFWPGEYIEAVERGETTVDPEEQHEAYVTATEVQLDESWAIEFTWKFLVFTGWPYVEGFDYTVESMPLYEAVWLAK